jgi:DHA1 family inner membrane transport protein
MTSTSTSPSSVAAGRMPWPSLLVLGAATFVMVTAEMLPTAVLRPMSEGLGAAEARVAQLVSLWAAVVVLASFPLVALTRRFDRRNVIAAGAVGLAASDLLTAAAPSYPSAAAGRLLGAAAVGLLWASVNAHVADLVPDRLLGPAVSVVLGCATAGMVVGTPIARLVADVAGWRVSFVVLGLLTAIVAALVPTVGRTGAGGGAAQRRDRDDDADRGIAPVLAIAVLVALVLVGHYGAYTYITVLTEAPARVLPGGTAVLLLAFGLASAAGLALAARVRDHTLAALAVTVLGTAGALAALGATGLHPVLGLGVVVAWGVASGAIPSLAQTEVLRRAGDRHRGLAGALIPVLFNGGIAIGAVLASLVAGAAGPAAVPLPSAGIVLAAGLVLARCARRAQRPGVEATEV